MTTRAFIRMLMVLGVLWLGLVWGMVTWLSTSEQGDISWSVLSAHHGVKPSETRISPKRS